MTIAEEVRALRSALGENAATFGARWQRSGRTVEGWEQGQRVPDAFVLEAMRKLAARVTTRTATNDEARAAGKAMMRKHGKALARLAKKAG